MSERYWLDPEQICSKECMKDYFTVIFGLNGFTGNLDELNDCLSEITKDITINIHREAMIAVCNDEYSYRVLMVLMNAAEDNPHITVHLRLRAPKEIN